VTRSTRSSRILLVGSSGGHLAQLLALEPVWGKRDRFWVTFRTPDAVGLLAAEQVYWCYHPTNRSIRNLLRNTVLAARILWRERPSVIVSAGGGAAVPFFWIGRALGAVTIFVEVIDRLETRTLTGRAVAPVASHILVQWPEQLALYPKARLIGPLL